MPAEAQWCPVEWFSHSFPGMFRAGNLCFLFQGSTLFSFFFLTCIPKLSFPFPLSFFLLHHLNFRSRYVHYITHLCHIHVTFMLAFFNTSRCASANDRNRISRRFSFFIVDLSVLCFEKKVYLPQKCAHVLYCPIKIGVLLNLLCV